MKIASLFSGCGGLDLGFIQAGFDVIWGNDLFSEAVETYRKNIGDHILEADVASVNSADIPKVDGIIGGFPCQGFSMANAGRHVDDSRNQLYRHFVRLISDKAPKFFIAENVKGILSLGKGAVFEKITQDFSDAGYTVLHHLFNAADYGVPQRRERVIILGIRSDIVANYTAFPPPVTHSRKPCINSSVKRWVSVGDALAGLPEPGVDSQVANHTGTSYKLRHNGYLGHRQVNPDEPAPTITARGDHRGGVVIIHHPNNLRRLTVREAAIVQGFPDNFVFEGSNTSAYRQIGNAVPPPLAKAVALSVREVLNIR